MEQCARGTAKLTRAPENWHNSERVDFAQTVQRSLKRETNVTRSVECAVRVRFGSNKKQHTVANGCQFYVVRTVPKQFQTLVFSSSRLWCEKE